MNETQYPSAGDLLGALFFAVVVLAAGYVAWWIVAHTHAAGYWVYEIDTEDGLVLYIGSAGDVEKRLRGHERFQAKLPEGHPRKWWADAEESVRATYEPSRKTWYRSKPIALEAEKDRIRRKNPIANRIRYKGVPGGSVD
jgi:predicted GIY-YIG superfamily endonuclease